MAEDDSPSFSTKDPYTGLHAESIYALWHDPSTYDHMKMGPPYLPEMKVRTAVARVVTAVDREAVRNLVRKEAQASAIGQIFSTIVRDYQGMPMAELGAFLAVLRAASMVHQTHHWQTRGDTFFSDHKLYEQLYNESQEPIDKIAERAVGLGTHLLVHPVIQAAHVGALVKHFCGDILSNPSADAYALVSLAAEIGVLSCLDEVRASLQNKGQLSTGTDNLLPDIADQHEVFVYLLKQRSISKVSYDRR